MGSTNHPEPVDFDSLREWKQEVEERDAIIEQAAEKLERIAGWLYWYDNGGGAGRTISGIRDVLAGNDEEG